ncbi:MAG: DUF883 family protein [Betaproteobacteria bacterium]|nr:DUF883 family protein [Betaproteobacteria bacterium]
MSHPTLLKKTDSSFTHSTNGLERAASKADRVADNVTEVTEETRAAIAQMVNDVQQIVSRVGPQATEEMRELVDSVRSTAKDLGSEFEEVSDAARTRLHEGAERAREVVRDRPVQSVTVAALLGVALGAFIARR